MSLDILIPTYNRVKALEKNVLMLVSYIDRVHRSTDINIRVIISNNKSEDDTNVAIDRIIKMRDDVILLNQKENIGLEGNAVYLLSISNAKYVMYLGDDDYLEYDYFREVLTQISSAKYGCIIPSFVAKTIDNKIVSARGVGEKCKYKAGMEAILKASLLGHQLSGIVFLRDATLENYLKKTELRNIYLFISFVGFNAARGNVLMLGYYPVTVTMGEKKYWGYGDDCLFSEKIKNTHIITDKNFIRYLLQVKFFYSNLFSIYLVYGDFQSRLRAVYLAVASKYLSRYTLFTTPLIMAGFLVSMVHRYLSNKIKINILK